MKFRTAYTTWIQETSREFKKELEKCKVTNWVQGQRSRQFGIAGHVMRKQDGRWSKALIQCYEGKITNGNPPTIDCDHDIRNWFHNKFPQDHRTWQETAMNSNEWAVLGPLYAADWQTNGYTKIENQNQRSNNITIRLVEQTYRTKDKITRTHPNTAETTNDVNSKKESKRILWSTNRSRTGQKADALTNTKSTRRTKHPCAIPIVLSAFSMAQKGLKSHRLQNLCSNTKQKQKRG